MGGTVPGKAFEMTCYAGGVNAYGPESKYFYSTCLVLC